MPVTGAVCLIVAGANGQRGLANRWLSHPWLISIGDIAFGIYLWHWPLYIFYREFAAVEQVSVLAGLAIMGLSILLAALNSRVLEANFRPLAGTAGVARAYAVGTLFFLPAASAPGAIKLHFVSLPQEQTAAIEPFDLPLLKEQHDASTVPYEQFLAAKRDLPLSYTDDCHQATPESEVVMCAYGDTNSETVLALVGGSHATQWLPALEKIGLQHNLKILNISKSHCPFGALEDPTLPA